ncbi:type I polyketide synthase [Streptomyces sp. NPDC055107]
MGVLRNPVEELRARLADLPENEQLNVLLGIVRAAVAEAQGSGSGREFAATAPFRSLGLVRERTAAMLRTVSEETGIPLTDEVVFDFPDPAALAGHLRSALGIRTPRAVPTRAGRTPDAAADDPIAVVGVACRFPGGITTPEGLWELVERGADAVTGFPTDRAWDLEGIYHPDPEHAGTSYTRSGAFIEDIAGFDADFFGISPREAVAMDPQQRLLLEVAWEAVERAGIAPLSLRGSMAGVYIGTNEQDYLSRYFRTPSRSEGFLISGNAASVLSGRLSYVLGLHGPSVTVDTACSSSLVALHQACQALRLGECDLALTGAVALMSSPGAFVDFARKHVHAADGRCKAYADAADGTGWGEGVGVLVLERLSDARRAGHRVLALVRGSAVNQDGASNGLTAPNGPAQERVIRQALANAGLSPAQIDAVDGHGTGTTLGDAVEGKALLATYGGERPDGEPLWLGSVKSNIGHTQATSGIASLIKMIWAMEHGVLPATVHMDRPSTRIDWAAGAVRVLERSIPWPERGGPRRAGISSFGVSGTNSHVVIEQPAPLPAESDQSADGTGPPTGTAGLPWVVSARTPDALRAQAGRLRALSAADPAASAADIGAALVRSRSPFAHRAVLVADDHEEFTALLGAVESGVPADGLVTGAARPGLRGPVFVFPGHGGHWAGMGAALLDRAPAFAAAVRECDAVFGPLVPWSVEGVLRQAPGAPPVDDFDVTQPVSFTVAVALAALWRSYGVEPAAVVGHSQGEIAAAVVAGALSLTDAARVLVVRTRALKRLLGNGAMAAVPLPLAEVERLLEPYGERLSVATVNGPAQITVSGEPDAVDGLLAELEARGVRARRIRGAHAAGHSAQVDAVREEFLTGLAQLTPRPPAIPFFSPVTGGRPAAGTARSDLLDADYWFRNARSTVRFDSAVRAALGEGHDVFVECGPHPILLDAVADLAYEAGVVAVTSGTLRRDEGDAARFHRSAAELYVAGVDVDWTAAYPGEPVRRVDLPTYPFQHKRFWLEPAAPESREPAGPAAVDRSVDPFWQAVAGGDPERLARLLGIGEDGQAAALRSVLPALTDWHDHDRFADAIDSWRYQVRWQPAGPRETDASGRGGPWLVVLPASHAQDPYARAVLDAVADSRIVRTLTVTGTDDRRSLAEAIGAVLPGGAPAGVISLLALDEAPSVSHPEVPAGTAATVALMQALVDRDDGSPLWVLTRGAVSTGDTDPLTRPVQAQAAALGRVFALERPGQWGGVIDLPEQPGDAGTHLLTGLLAGGLEDQFALRDGEILVRRLVHAPRTDRQHPPARGWRPRPDGTVLVTGGTGAAAGHIATWLASHGAGHLLLASRRGPRAPGIRERVAGLEALGARVTVVSCDVRDREAVRDLLASVPEDLPLTAIVHTAGIGRLQSLATTTRQDFSDVFAAKATGAQHLHELTQEMGIELDAFVLFSAVSAVWGVGRHGHYGAANAYLLALAEHRRALGLAATGVAWTGWAGSGMAVEDASQEALRRHRLADGAFDELGMSPEKAAMETARLWGLSLVEPALQLEVLRQALDDGDTVTMVAEVDWEQFTTGYASARRRPLLQDIPAARAVMDDLEAPPAASASSGGASEVIAPDHWQRELGAAEPGRRQELVLDLVRGQLAEVLGHGSAGDIDPDRAFLEMGLDSITAVKLRNRLGNAVGLRLPATVAFNHPNPRELAGYLLAELPLPTGPDPAAPASAPGTSAGQGADDTLLELYNFACANGRVDDAVSMLQVAGRLRPTFSGPQGRDARPRPVRLAEGSAGPALICLTPYVAPAGAHQYARFAASFRGVRDMWVLPHPGFAKGEPLPADLDALFATQAEAALECAGGAPFVLLGYSSGGWVAHGTAARLEALGRPAAGVVMLDSFSLRHRDDARVFSTMMKQYHQLEGSLSVAAEELTAMGHYMPLFHRWAENIPDVSLPTLLVRAEDQAVLNSETGAVTPPPEHVETTVPVPGNHYSLMQEHAGRAAAAVDSWLTAQFAAS